MISQFKKILITIFLLLIAHSSFADCTIDDIKGIRSDALKLYQQDNYADAEKILSNFYSYENDCGFYEMAQGSDELLNQGLWLISDLMFYRKKVGDIFGCMDLDDEVYTTWMVSDPKRYKAKVSKAIKTNARQCQEVLDTDFSEPKPCPIKGYESMYSVPSEWSKQDKIYYEVTCMGFRKNGMNIMGYQRDAAQYRSESMNDIARFEVLYIDNIVPIDSSITTHFSLIDYYWENSSKEDKWQKKYKLDQLYVLDQEGELWNEGYCYDVKVLFGKKAGRLFLDGGSSPCNGGSAAFRDRFFIQLNYPFNGHIVNDQKHTYK